MIPSLVSFGITIYFSIKAKDAIRKKMGDNSSSIFGGKVSDDINLIELDKEKDKEIMRNKKLGVVFGFITFLLGILTVLTLKHFGF